MHANQLSGKISRPRICRELKRHSLTNCYLWDTSTINFTHGKSTAVVSHRSSRVCDRQTTDRHCPPHLVDVRPLPCEERRAVSCRGEHTPRAFVSRRSRHTPGAGRSGVTWPCLYHVTLHVNTSAADTPSNRSVEVSRESWNGQVFYNRIFIMFLKMCVQFSFTIQ